MRSALDGRKVNRQKSTQGSARNAERKPGSYKPTKPTPSRRMPSMGPDCEYPCGQGGMRRGDALGKACMTEPSAYRQFVIPVRSKRVMQLDVQVQITFERCGLRVNDSDRRGDHRNE